MNQYAIWKYLLVAVVLLTGALYALPNLYGEDPAIQIAAERGASLDESLRARVDETLAELGITPERIERREGSLLVRFASEAAQLRAREPLAAALGPGYTTALNLAPATPGWLRYIGGKPMYLGLDLRGGVHFLMEVDMAAVKRQAEERYVSDIKRLLRENRIRYRPFDRSETGGIPVRFRNAADRDQARALIREEFPDLELSEADQAGEPILEARMSEEALREIRKFALQQNITTLRNRVNELGVAEPIIQQQGQERIVVQLPGVQDTTRAKEILGATATLEFRMVDTEGSVEDALDGKTSVRSRLYRTREGEPVLLQKDVMLTGDSIIDAASGLDQQSGSPAVFITLDGKGARKFSRETADKIGRPMAVVFIENKTVTVERDGEFVKEKRRIEEVINIATIRDQLSKRFQITGLDSTEEARDLALLLRAGALAAPIEIVEERTVGPSLGAENIERGFLSVQIGFLLVIVIMALYYRLFGLIAAAALTCNLMLVVALLSMLQATLTLPGIAGVVLTVGMAVDANVLIFERIREELRNGMTPQGAIHAGYARAFSTILDANITTLIAAVVLFSFGTGPIKGFAVTLSLGIVTSMFTAIVGTRAAVNLIHGGRRLSRLAI